MLLAGHDAEVSHAKMVGTLFWESTTDLALLEKFRRIYNVSA